MFNIVGMPMSNYVDSINKHSRVLENKYQMRNETIFRRIVFSFNVLIKTSSSNCIGEKHVKIKIWKRYCFCLW